MKYRVDPPPPDALLDHYFSLTGWVEALAKAGARVTVLQRYPQAATLSRNGINYQFIPDRYGPDLRGWQMPGPLLAAAERQAQAGQPTVMHFHGMVYPLQVGWLRRHLPADCALVVQHHGERPFAIGRRLLQRWGLRQVDGFFFANRALADEWISGGLIPRQTPVYEVMETSSNLRPEDRAEARQKTGLTGSPILLWAGNLKPNKDPLTILRGLARILPQAPSARLYMAFRERDLLPEVEACIAASPALQAAVTLLGEIPYGEMAAYYSSADIFVQGSAKEGSGIALMDALACGAIPVVTDIPPFRTLTDNGRLGALWPVGDQAAFVRSLRQVMGRPLAPLSRACRQYFEQHWRFAPIAETAVAAYTAVIARRDSRDQPPR